MREGSRGGAFPSRWSVNRKSDARRSERPEKFSKNRNVWSFMDLCEVMQTFNNNPHAIRVCDEFAISARRHGMRAFHALAVARARHANGSAAGTVRGRWHVDVTESRRERGLHQYYGRRLRLLNAFHDVQQKTKGTDDSVRCGWRG